MQMRNRQTGEVAEILCVSFDFHTSNIYRGAIFPYTKLGAPPEGRSLTADVTIARKMSRHAFSRVSAISRPQALFSPPSFLLREKRWCRRRHPASSGRENLRAFGAACALRAHNASRVLRARYGHPPLSLQDFVKKKILSPLRQKPRDESISGYFVVPPMFRGRSPPFLRAGGAELRRFRRVRLIRLLGGCPSRSAPQEPFSILAPSLTGARRYCFRVMAGFSFQRTDFLVRTIMRQSRSPRWSPRISISAEARFVAHGTL